MAWSIRVDKSFTYRGSAEIWSNRYHFNGSNPADATEWLAIATALINTEKTLYSSATTVVFVAGYTSDTGPAVYTKDYTIMPAAPVPGSFSTTGLVRATGDDAAWVRWWCGQYSSRGKKVYARKYYHDVYMPSTGGDSLATTQKTAYGTHGSLLMTGMAVTGYSTRYICDKSGNVAQSYNNVTYITTRTLKRRGGSPL